MTDVLPQDQLVKLLEGWLALGLYAPTPAALLAWFRADTLALHNGDLVPTWPDSSGNGNNLASGAGTATFVTGVQNGLPAVNLAGSDYFFNNALTNGPFAPPFTAFLVFKAASASGTQSLLSRVAASTPQLAIASGAYSQSNNTGSITGGTADTNAHLIVANWQTGSGSQLLVDGVSLGTASIGSNDLDTLVAGSYLGSDIFSGYLMELIVMAGDDVHVFDRYLKFKWGL